MKTYLAGLSLINWSPGLVLWAGLESVLSIVAAGAFSRGGRNRVGYKLCVVVVLGLNELLGQTCAFAL